MALRLEELAKTIDHTLLDGTATLDDVERLCTDACEHHFAAAYVLPTFVPQAVEHLRGCDVKVGTVVSYPLGQTPRGPRWLLRSRRSRRAPTS